MSNFQEIANNGWKLYNDRRLPPGVRPFWNYEFDSWTWGPKEYNFHRPYPQGDNAMTLTRDYDYFIHKMEPSVIQPLWTARAGMSYNNIEAIQSDSLYSYPDIRSDTRQSQEILNKFWMDLSKRNMLLPPTY